MRFGKRGKLSPRFIGPYEILDRVGAVAYRLALLPELSFIHPVFHVSMLRKCISDSSQVFEAPAMPLDEKLSYEEEPMAIVDRQVRKLRSKEIEFVKVLWRNHTVEEATWEIEDAMRVKYPHLFQSTGSGEGDEAEASKIEKYKSIEGKKEKKKREEDEESFGQRL
ncbi:uncharacterized protein [Nicotiana tomentosiformis]|uniref:uncharacterized protein n=1 Tax=Nicotiana tomentosiformis TaxID=4098 RepID=UPI00388C3C59